MRVKLHSMLRKKWKRSLIHTTAQQWDKKRKLKTQHTHWREHMRSSRGCVAHAEERGCCCQRSAHCPRPRAPWAAWLHTAVSGGTMGLAWWVITGALHQWCKWKSKETINRADHGGPLTIKKSSNQCQDASICDVAIGIEAEDIRVQHPCQLRVVRYRVRENIEHLSRNDDEIFKIYKPTPVAYISDMEIFN